MSWREVADPLTAMTVALHQRPGFFRTPVPVEDEAALVPSATQTAEPTWQAEPESSAKAESLSGLSESMLATSFFFFFLLRSNLEKSESLSIFFFVFFSDDDDDDERFDVRRLVKRPRF